MFECCAYNVAMGNVGFEIKEAADYITDDVNEEVNQVLGKLLPFMRSFYQIKLI